MGIGGICVLVIQLCPTLCDAMNCSPLGSSVHGILQARILECVAISFCLNIVKTTYDKSIANIILNNEKLKAFPVRSGARQKCLLSPPSFNAVLEVLTTTIQFSSVAQSCPTLCNPMNRSMPGLPVHHQLPESTQTSVHWVGDAFQPSPPLSSLLLLPSIFPSIRVFSNELALCIKWPKYWSFRFNSSPTNQHPGLISFRMDWLHLLAVQGTLMSLLQ